MAVVAVELQPPTMVGRLLEEQVARVAAAMAEKKAIRVKMPQQTLVEEGVALEL